MSVSDHADSLIKYGALLGAGLLAGGLAAYVIDGVPDMAIPAVGIFVLAVILYLEHET